MHPSIPHPQKQFLSRGKGLSITGIRVFIFSLFLSLSLTTFPLSLAAQSPCVVEIEIPDGTPLNTMVRRDLAIAADGRVWFTQLELNQIGMYDPTSQDFAFFDIPTPDSGPHSIAVDSAGIVWFTETDGHQIGQFDPLSETFTEEPTPSPQSKPYGITIDSMDNVWFTEMNTVKIGKRLATTGEIIEFSLDPAEDSVENLTIDAVTGEVWITDLANGKLIRLDPTTGDIAKFTIPYFLSSPHSVAVHPDGKVWFSDIVRNQIGRLNPTTGRFQRVPIPTPGAAPHGIIVDSRGLVWFTELQGNKVAFIIPQLFNSRVVELSLSTPNGGPYFIAEAPDKEIWFIEAHASRLGRLPCTSR